MTTNEQDHCVPHLLTKNCLSATMIKMIHTLEAENHSCIEILKIIKLTTHGNEISSTYKIDWCGYDQCSKAQNDCVKISATPFERQFEIGKSKDLVEIISESESDDDCQIVEKIIDQVKNENEAIKASENAIASAFTARILNFDIKGFNEKNGTKYDKVNLAKRLPLA